MSRASYAVFSENDDVFVRRAIDEAHLNALRVALYYQTGDRELAAMRVETHAPAGTPFLAYVVAREHHTALKEKAYAYLTDPEAPRRGPPNAECGLDLMQLFQGDAFDSTAAAAFGLEELGFEEFPREAHWSDPAGVRAPAGFMVTIIGAGFSGILAGIMLDRLGIDFRIVERQADVGGTWQLNDYPEARVDITNFIYQYSFINNYPWKSYFASRDELKDYIDHVVDSFELRPRIELQTKLTHARWNEARRRWDVTIERHNGRTEIFETNILLSAAGLFSTPKLPDIPDIGTYRGAMFHTTAWDHGIDPAGKRIAVIGTGSTGSQLMPALARQAAHLTVFQRTPNWVTPMRGYRDAVSPEQRWLFDTMPFYSNWYRYSQYVAQLQNLNFHELDEHWRAGGGMINSHNDRLRTSLTDYIRRKVGTRPDLLAKLIPQYAPLARRLVVDNGWYDALLRENVELVTEGIERFTETGIVTRDGRERTFDMVVLGAGFEVSRYLWPATYEGRDGATLEELWAKDGGRAHLTMSLPGFPNFFMLYGPNAGIRAGSFHALMESLMRYVASAIVAMIEAGGEVMEVRREVYEDYNARLDAGLKRMLWEAEGGGGGYYVNAFGRAGTQMPWTLAEFYDMVRAPDLADFRIS